MSSQLRFVPVCLLLLTAGCGTAQQILDARIANSTPSRFVSPLDESTTPRHPSLLLFVHGIFGDTLATWKKTGQDKGLPEYVLERPDIGDDFDAFVFGFPSAIVKQGSLSIPGAAATLLSEIDDHNLLAKYRRIVIVAHSMGGLVALEALTTDSALRAHVPLVVAFATPYEGAQVTQLGREVLENQAIVDMVPVNSGNSFLLSMTQRWKRAKARDTLATVVRCAYETAPVPTLGVIVPPTSAMSLCEDISEPIAEDHLGIVKPSSREHASIRVIANAIKALPALSSPTTEAPEATAAAPRIEPTLVSPQVLSGLAGDQVFRCQLPKTSSVPAVVSVWAVPYRNVTHTEWNNGPAISPSLEQSASDPFAWTGTVDIDSPAIAARSFGFGHFFFCHTRFAGDEGFTGDAQKDAAYSGRVTTAAKQAGRTIDR